MDRLSVLAIASFVALNAFALGLVTEEKADLLITPPPAMRLVGLGCQGAQGVLYAMHEDDFPPCEAIQAL